MLLDLCHSSDELGPPISILAFEPRTYFDSRAYGENEKVELLDKIG
jgi:hypothetical protein